MDQIDVSKRHFTQDYYFQKVPSSNNSVFIPKSYCTEVHSVPPKTSLSSPFQLQPMSGTSSKPTATSSSPVLHPTSYQLVSTPHSDSLNRNSSLLQQRSLVLDYLCHNCYISTAKAFARDSTVRQLDADGDEILDVPGGPDAFRLSESLLAQIDLRKRGGSRPFYCTALTPYFT